MKNIRGLCKSKKCIEERKCMDCGVYLRLGPSNGPRCYECHRKFRLSYEQKYHGRVPGAIYPNRKHKAKPETKACRCRTCPSMNSWGRCGAVVKGPDQWIPAIAVRLKGNCPRQHGIRDVLTPKD